MPISTDKKNALKGRLALILTTIIWGSSFVMMKNTLEYIPTFYILAFRFSGAAILMLPLCLKHLKKIDKSYIIGGAALGLCLFLGYTFQTYGLSLTTPSKNAFLTTTYCIFTPFIYWLTAKRRPNCFNISAALICLVGVGFVSLERDFSFNLGDILTICSGMFYAVYIVVTDRVIKGRSVVLLTMIQFAVAGLLSWGSALAVYPFPANVPASSVWTLVYLCVMCTTACFVMQTYGQKHTPPATAAIIMTFESVFGALTSVIFGEVLSLRLIIGFALIFAAVLISETKLRFLRKRSFVSE